MRRIPTVSRPSFFTGLFFLASLMLPMAGQIACAHKPQAASSPQVAETSGSGDERTRVLSATPGGAWRAVVEAAREKEYPLLESDSTRRVLSTDWMVVESLRAPLGRGDTRGVASGNLASIAEFPETKKPIRTIRQGQSLSMTTTIGEAGQWTRCRYRFRVQVSALSADSSEVALTPEIECWEDAFRKSWVPCQSKGTLEGQFFEEVQQKLQE